MFDVSASLRGKQFVEIRVPRKMTFGHRGVKFVDCKRGRGRGGATRKSDNFKSGHDTAHCLLLTI